MSDGADIRPVQISGPDATRILLLHRTVARVRSRVGASTARPCSRPPYECPRLRYEGRRVARFEHQRVRNGPGQTLSGVAKAGNEKAATRVVHLPSPWRNGGECPGTAAEQPAPDLSCGPPALHAAESSRTLAGSVGSGSASGLCNGAFGKRTAVSAD